MVGDFSSIEPLPVRTAWSLGLSRLDFVGQGRVGAACTLRTEHSVYVGQKGRQQLLKLAHGLPICLFHAAAY